MVEYEEIRIIIFLVVLYFAYLSIGAAVFHALEFANEQALYSETLKQLQQYNLTDVSENITVKNLIEIVLRARSNGIQFNSDLQPIPAQNWNWPNAFFFAGTVITTIGYGNISPTTDGSKVFCIFFAAFGLPIFGVMFYKIGKTFIEMINYLHKRIKSGEGRPKYRKTIVPLISVGIVVLLFLVFPALIFMAVEDWTFLDSFYYSFITLTTIGFGDFVAGTNPNDVDTSYTIYRVAVYFWILFGLAYVAAVIGFFHDIIKKEVNLCKNKKTKEDPRTEAYQMQENNPSNALIEIRSE